MENEGDRNWSEKVEDLVDSGDIEAAISLLETLISNLETLNSSDSRPQLASALIELAKLYSSKGLSLKSDDARSCASAINLSLDSLSLPQSSIDFKVSRKELEGDNLPASGATRDQSAKDEDSGLCTKSSDNNAAPQGSSDDDWEAIADRAPDELFSPECLPEVSKLSLNGSEVKVPKRRGRGNFAYREQGLYSDQHDNDYIAYDSPDEVVDDRPEKISGTRNLCGTHHVLVLDGFHPSTMTTDLEKLFEGNRDRGLAIRWVNDTIALAVFRTPSVALEALNSVHCSFSVRVLEEDDPIMGSFSTKDLDPPRQRPKTSARTAQRRIAQELGVKMPTTFGSRELRRQEDARKNRIVTRQNLRDEAWGPDDLKSLGDSRSSRKG